MKNNARLNLLGKIMTAAMLLFVTACSSSLVIKKVDFAQPLESVLTPNSKGIVQDARIGLKFNVMPLQYAETKDTTSVTTQDVRLIRGHAGYYFVTARGFNDVFVMEPSDGTLKLKKKIHITDQGLQNPAFNQRTPYVQLLDGSSASYNLTKDGIKGKEK